MNASTFSLNLSGYNSLRMLITLYMAICLIYSLKLTIVNASPVVNIGKNSGTNHDHSHSTHQNSLSPTDLISNTEYFRQMLSNGSGFNKTILFKREDVTDNIVKILRNNPNDLLLTNQTDHHLGSID